MKIDLNNLTTDSKLLHRIVTDLINENSSLKDVNHFLQGEKTSLQEQITYLKEQLALLKKQRFGKSSEKLDKQIDELETKIEESELLEAASDRNKAMQQKISLKIFPSVKNYQRT